jgi:hypothetical protein
MSQPKDGNEIKLEPVTASVWGERTFIVCVNPINPDDKMEFSDLVELNEKLFELKMLSDSLKRMITRRDKSLVKLNEKVEALTVAGNSMDNAISEIDPQRLERHRFMQMTDNEYLAVMKWRTAKDPNYNRA